MYLVCDEPANVNSIIWCTQTRASGNPRYYAAYANLNLHGLVYAPRVPFCDCVHKLAEDPGILHEANRVRENTITCKCWLIHQSVFANSSTS